MARETGRQKVIKRGPTKSAQSLSSLAQYTGMIATSISVAVFAFHWYYLSGLHENDLYFSHLSSLERELTFRTEMGLYYSHYKTVISSQSVPDALHRLTADNLTEWPSTINTLQRFNVYPEVMVGVLYRGVNSMLSWLGLSGTECFTISRGMGLQSVQACNGVGDPAYFYVNCIFALNGLLPVLLFALAMMLSNSLLGACLTVLMFLYNHSEATRVMWTPPLRESFAMPFHYLQLIALTRTLKQKTTWSFVLLCICSVAQLLAWQFTPLALMTQSLSLLVLWSLGLLPSIGYLLILTALLVALVISSILQFGNIMLLSSFFVTSILAGMTTICLRLLVSHRLPYPLLRSGLEILCGLSCTLLFKWILNNVLDTSDDAHIGTLLLAKLTAYKDFHTQLYLCSKEFDFLPLSYVGNTTLTLLVPAAAVVIVTVLWTVWRMMDRMTFDPCLVATTYHVVQCMWYIVMATLIMRLKVFLTPQLALLTSLIRDKGHKVIVLVCVLSSLAGLYNIKYHWSIVGEFNSPDQEELVYWIQESTNQNGVFAGAMPTTATVRLCTDRPIVNHPHYEHTDMRARTELVYTVYSRKPPEAVLQSLISLGVTHVIVEEVWCHKSYKTGCSFGDVWDLKDNGNSHRPLFCDLVLQGNVQGFKIVFRNSRYIVLELDSN